MKNRILVISILLSVFAGIAFGQNMTVKDSDTNTLMQVEDKGTTGVLSVSAVSTDSVEINSMGAAPDKTTNKLYNLGGSLYWNGSAIGMSSSAGGWTDGGTDVYLSNTSDNVGIGTTSPSHKLDVRGDIITGADGSGGTLRLAAADATHEGGQIVWNGAGLYDFWVHDIFDNSMRIFTNSENDNQIEIFNGGAGTMGLSVGGSVEMTGFKLTTSPSSGYVLTSDGSGNGTWQAASGGGGGWTDDGTAVRLTTITDKVGIGLTSPAYPLDVDSTIGLSNTQVLYLPDQSKFEGTLYVGDGGGSLISLEGGGSGNTAIGLGALESNTTGSSNTASGRLALYLNTTGDANTATGSGALRSNTTGSKNVAMGMAALYHNTTGLYNAAVGSYANFYNQAGSNNTIIGYEAGRSTSTHDKSGNVFIGYQAGYYETGSNKLYIENSNSTTPLIGGDFDADEIYLNGKVGIGLTSPAYPLDVDSTIGLSNTQILYLPDQSKFEGTLYVGDGGGSLDAGYLSEGYYNTAVGIGALNANIEGKGNTAIGNESLYSNTTGDNNTACGFWALYTNTTGDRNTASGYRALNNNTTGIYNTAIGSDALLWNTTGNYNVGIGFGANLLNQAGSNNTIIGYEAGRSTSTHDKSGNVFIGYQAGYSETGSNKLYIENSSGSTPLIGGDFDANRVGINTNSPGTAFAVVGLTGTSSYNNVIVNTATGDFYYATSSGRYKEDIQTLESDFHKILDVEPRSYTDKASGQREIGYIAEEFEERGLQDLVIYNDENIPDGLKYEKISLYLVEVVKEQQETIDTQEETISDLQEQIRRIEMQLELLANR